jgi:hypothetical protein
MKRVNSNAIPDFSSIEREKEYWESKGLLNTTRAAQNNKVTPGTKRDSFLNIRLSGEELTQLRDLAAVAGTGPSTYARILIKNALDQNSKVINNEYSQRQAQVLLARDADLQEVKSIAPAGFALIELGKTKIDPDIVKSLFETLQKTCNCTVVNPEDKGYAEIEKLIRETLSV